MADRGLVPFVMGAFKVIAIHPNGPAIPRIIAAGISLGSLICMSLMALILVGHAKDLETFIAALESFGICQQLFWKVTTYMYRLNTINRLLVQIRNEFWPLNTFGLHLETKLDKIHRFVMYGLRAFLVIVIVAASYMNIRAWTAEKRETALHVYNFVDFSNNYYYAAITFLAALCTLPYMAFIFAFDGLFITLITLTACQMIMLRFAFKQLNTNDAESKEGEEKIYEATKGYIQHHDKILKFADEIKEIYSLPLLVQFSTSTILICVSIYLFTVQGFPNLSTAFRCTFLAIVYLLQISVYCAAGNTLTEICNSVGDGIYKSDWWSQNKRKLRIATQMIIMRSQIEQKLLAGGMFILKLNTFTTILRASYSFFMLLHSSESEKKKL